MKIDIESNKNRFKNILLKRTKRNGIHSLIYFLEEKTNFFESPASSRYHLAVPGGLVKHCLSVFAILRHLNFILNLHLTEEEIAIVSLLHDICKVNIYRSKDNSYIVEDHDPIGHGEKSVIILQKFIKLSKKEIAMIRYHMGPYDETFMRHQNAILRQYPEVKAVYFADDISTTYLEGGDEKDEKSNTNRIAPRSSHSS